MAGSEDPALQDVQDLVRPVLDLGQVQVLDESHDLVDHLREIGKQVDYLVFENEGHDVLKYENRVTCYNTITEFFEQHLNK